MNHPKLRSNVAYAHVGEGMVGDRLRNFIPKEEVLSMMNSIIEHQRFLRQSSADPYRASHIVGPKKLRWKVRKYMPAAVLTWVGEDESGEVSRPKTFEHSSTMFVILRKIKCFVDKENFV